MGLTDKKSLLDRNIKGTEGVPVGQSLPQEGSYFNPNGVTNSPFSAEEGEGDHMKDLLKNRIVSSQNSGQTYDPSLMTGNIPAPAGAIETFPDFDGLQGPQFQRGVDAADQIQKSSLSAVPGFDSNSPFNDRIDASGTSTPTGYIDNLPS